MAIDIYNMEQTKIGEIDPAGDRPAVGDCLYIASESACFKVMAVLLDGTLTSGSPDLYKFDGGGSIFMDQCGAAKCSAQCKLPQAFKEALE